MEETREEEEGKRDEEDEKEKEKENKINGGGRQRLANPGQPRGL